MTRWQIALLVESAALAIALLMPVTPSKTGSETGLADYLVENPTYLEEALVYFALTNILLGVLGVVLWLLVRYDKSTPKQSDPAVPPHTPPDTA